jgi:hypothetical protein
VPSQSVAANIDNPAWRLLRGLGKHVRNQNSILIDPINDAPGAILVWYPQLMAARSNARHRSRVGHRQQFTGLEQAEHPASLRPRLRGKWGRFDHAGQRIDLGGSLPLFIVGF